LQVVLLTYGSRMSEARYLWWLTYWQFSRRGVPISLLAFTSIFSTGLGSVFGGLIASNPHLGWRWVQWVHVMFVPKETTVSVVSSDIIFRFAGAFVLCTILVLCETRPDVILARIAKNVRKTTGDTRYRSSSEIDKSSMLSLIKTTCKRPLCAQDKLFSDLLTVQFQIYC
jgi:MFS family permease